MKVSLPKAIQGLMILSVVAVGASTAEASSVVFDSFSGTVRANGRFAGSSPGSLIDVSISQTITNIAVRNDLNSNGSLKFLIFDHNDHSLLFESSSQAFTDDGMSWKKSDAFSFTLQAGKKYDVGAIANVGGSWAFDSISESQNGITSILSNPNFRNFSDPEQAGHATGTDAAVRLYGGESTTVPTPGAASAGVMLMGGLLFWRRRTAR